MTLQQLKDVFPTEEAFPDPKFIVYGQSGLVAVSYTHSLYKVEELIEKIHEAGYKLDSLSTLKNELVIQVQEIEN